MKPTIRIGLDLDGVIVDKPPGIPKGAIEWLVRSHTGKGLAYRFPTSRIERTIRWLSHAPLLRPPIKENLDALKKIIRHKGTKLYLISGRYAFLKDRTEKWLKCHQLSSCFERVMLNLENTQPHIFKEEKIRELDIQVFVDDDAPLVEYLSKKFPERRLLCLNKKNTGKKETLSLQWIEKLEEAIPK